MKLRETKGDQVSPSETKWAQVGNPVKSNESNWNQMIQVRPSGPKWVQVKLRETKWVQVKLCETKWVQVELSETDQKSPSENI